MKNYMNLRMDPGKKSIGRSTRIFSVGLLALSLLVTPLHAQDGQQIFKSNCAACHKTGGGGRLVGPDLTGVTTKRTEEWLMKWTKSSASLIASGDADAKAIFNEFAGVPMTEFPNLSDADIKAVYAYIATWGGGGTATTDTTKAAPTVDASVNATPQQIELGRKLFDGSIRFMNGGAACISCHNVNYKDVIPGGLLAKDLTNAYTRLGGDAGLAGILGAPPFPAMTSAYTNKALNTIEIAALSAFLYNVDKDVAGQEPKSSGILLFGGIATAIGLLIVIFGVWFVRKKDHVKKSIYNRQVKSI